MNVTYSPEDNKIRLYVGRVSHEDYLELRKAGYVATPRQDCDFVATWTPQREDLARQYLEDGEDIGDEDYSCLERSADRAERFECYRDKRASEAGASADAFEAGPKVFGNQNRARAERQAVKHDRSRTYAVSQWSKAEYWQRRTQGVIAAALYRAKPEVRRGRILEIEKLLRGATSQRWIDHLNMRLIYERGMLENEGGSASEVEMEVGGFLSGRQIYKINRSTVTGRVVSVGLLRPNSSKIGIYNIERLAADVYRAPTDAEREAFAKATAERKAAEKATKAPALKLINPTDEDAQRLQDLWNERAAVGRSKYDNSEVSTVWRMTQAQYSERSKGEYGPAGTVAVGETGNAIRHRSRDRVNVFKIRVGSPGSLYRASRVIVLTDKPQTQIPWKAIEDARKGQPTEESLFHRLGDIAKISGLSWYPSDPEQVRLFDDARYVGWTYHDSQSQFGFTEKGMEAYRRWNEVSTGDAAKQLETVQS